MKSASKVLLAALVASGQILPSLALAQTETPAAKAVQPTQASMLSLDVFQEQVRAGNQSYIASGMRAEGASLQAGESKLLTRPRLIAVASFSEANAQQPTPFAPTQNKVTTYRLGVEQDTTFGLAAAVTWNLLHIQNNLDLGGAGALGAGVLNDYWTSSPQLTLTQSLWRNWNGSELRANKDLREAAALSIQYTQSYQQIQLLAQAETAYWRLALARESVTAAKEVLGLSQKTKSWAQKRSRMELSDRADLLQSNAGLLARELNLQASVDEERRASRAFNTVRGVDSDVVAETLATFDPQMIVELKIPARAKYRADVKAAEQNKRIAEANARLARARNTPTVNLTGGIGLNGLDPRVDPAVRESVSNDFPNYAIGVNANIPLDFGTISNVREGYKKAEIAERVQYERALFEQERTWNDLTNAFQEANRRYKIAAEVEKAQRDKVDYERVRHSRGRTTLYNVILFETDLASSQYARIQSQADVLNAYAQLKTFVEEK